MADISILSRLINGVQRNVDLSANTLVVNVLKVGGGAGTDLTKTILDNLINLQNGSDFANGTNAHTHDGRYFTETELGSAAGTTGSDRIGDDDDYTNFTPTAATVKGALSGIDAALAAAASAGSFADDAFEVYDDADNTKKIVFQISGVATATTRIITFPDANVDLADVNNAILRNGSRAFTAAQSMGGFKLTNLAFGTVSTDAIRRDQAVARNDGSSDFDAASKKIQNIADPSAAQDAATKAYVDNLLDGRSWKNSARAASTADIDLSGGDPGAIDGVTLANGDRVLLKNQTAAEENGIYLAVDADDTATWIRTSDANTALELEGAAIFVEEGTANGDKQFAQTSDNFTLDTDPVVWVVTSANAFSGHDMISLLGGQISVDLAAVSGLESSNPGNAAGQLRVKLQASNPSLFISGSNELGVKFDAAGALLAGASGVAVQVDNASIEINSNALRVKAGGINENHLAASVAGAGLSGGAGSPLSVNVDDSTLEINSDTLRQKDAGTTAAKLNTNVADQSTITGGAGAALAVQHAPMVKRTMVAGEAFAANTSFAVRLALTGETAGRVYKADKDASSVLGYNAIGIALSTGAVSAGQNIDVWVMGEYTLGSSDTPFGAVDVGKEVFVGATGALILGAALANSANEAAFIVGVVQATNKVWVDFKHLRGIA